jgi:hypothetical protein
LSPCQKGCLTGGSHLCGVHNFLVAMELDESIDERTSSRTPACKLISRGVNSRPLDSIGLPSSRKTGPVPYLKATPIISHGLSVLGKSSTGLDQRPKIVPYRNLDKAVIQFAETHFRAVVMEKLSSFSFKIKSMSDAPATSVNCLQKARTR